MEMLSGDSYKDSIESVFVIGGSSVYDAAMSSDFCQRIYLTEVAKDFECDTFFPQFDKSVYKEVTLPGLNHDEQDENGVKYQLHVYSSGE